MSSRLVGILDRVGCTFCDGVVELVAFFGAGEEGVGGD
jgi:hypothetical protein